MHFFMTGSMIIFRFSPILATTSDDDCELENNNELNGEVFHLLGPFGSAIRISTDETAAASLIEVQ